MGTSVERHWIKNEKINHQKYLFASIHQAFSSIISKKINEQWIDVNLYRSLAFNQT